MRFAVTLVFDPARPFTRGLIDVADLLVGSLTELGHEAGRITNDWDPAAVNIVLGYHRLDALPEDRSFKIIVYQMEQLSDREGWFSDRLADMLRDADGVWDYSAANVSFLTSIGIRAVHVPIGYGACLERIPATDEQPTDVLFYGSLNERRARVLKALERVCNVQTLFNVYGRERDDEMAKAKIVLNLHFYSMQLFEVVRVSYLLNNRRFVVSETSNDMPMTEGLHVPYEELVETCRRYLADSEARNARANEGYEALKRQPMTGFIESALTI